MTAPSFRLVDAAQTARRSGGAESAWPLIFATSGDTTLFCASPPERFFGRLEAWDLYFRRKYGAVRIKCHGGQGIVLTESANDMVEKAPISLDAVQYDIDDIESSLLAQGFKMTNASYFWSLSVFPFGGLERPVWVTPFSSVEGEQLLVDARNGKLWASNDLTDCRPVNATVQRGAAFEPSGTVSMVQRRQTQASVPLESVIANLPLEQKAAVRRTVHARDEEIRNVYAPISTPRQFGGASFGSMPQPMPAPKPVEPTPEGEYLKELAAWHRMPFWRRWRTPRPKPPFELRI